MSLRNRKIAASALVIAGVCAGVWQVLFLRSDVDRGLLALKSAYRFQRPLEARLSGFDYAPLSNTRGSDSNTDLTARRQAERFLLDAERSEPGSSAYHTLGLLYLTELKFDSAIQQLSRSLAADDTDASVHSDLGAAILEKGRADQLNDLDGPGFEAFAQSLEHLNRALQLNGSLLEALFNRALCRQYLSLTYAATEDWKKYLDRDPASQWSEEARRHLGVLENQTSRTSADRTKILEAFLDAHKTHDDETAWLQLSLNRNVSGGFVENALLDRFLEQKANDRGEDARKTLEVLAYAADLNRRKANDHFLANVVRFYAAAAPAKRTLLAEARKVMNEGHQQLHGFTPEKAIELYTRAALIFDQLGNRAESTFVRYPLAHSYLRRQQSERALEIFQNVAQTAEANQYRWLLTHSLAGVGNVQMGLNEYSDALNNSNRARDMSEQIGDAHGQMKLADQLSNLYTRLGNYHQALASQRRALTLLANQPVDALQAWRTHFLIARPLQLLGLNAAAEDFQKESLRVATQANNLYSICRSHIGLGLIYGNRGNYEEAQQNARLAFELAKNISSEATRADTIGYSSLLLGDLYRQARDFTNAMESYDQVLRTFEASKYPAFLYAAHKGKLLSCIAQGGCPTVQTEIEETLDLFENYRARILEEENKFVFFDAEQNVYDAIIDYKFTQDPNGEAAFDFSERSRSRSLLDLTTKQTSPARVNAVGVTPVSQVPLQAPEVRQRMPEHLQILQYSVLEHRVLIWLISSFGVKSFARQVEARDLREKVSRYVQLLSRPSAESEEEIRNLAVDLHDLLIKPAESSLDQNKQLCLVPDKALNHLPYAALVSRSSGKYLTEEYVLTRAPSATLLVVGYEKARNKETATSEKLLSVGNPRFDRRSFPQLADLPESKREAEEIAAVYNSAPAITGANALIRRVVSRMEDADVIHLAMHAVVNEHAPLRSKLLFTGESSAAGDSFESGTLPVAELSKIPLPRTRLVVLSACETALGRYYDGEGMVGIARPFIAQGVPLVVATLWPVDSQATAELMINFHRKRVQGQLSTAVALSQAQREMLNSDNGRRHPYYWASFVLIGGHARF